jgi:DNA-binding GntR family transcriptional regulator
VVRAIAARDEAEAAAAMRAHLLRVRDAYRSFAGAEAPPEV